MNATQRTNRPPYDGRGAAVVVPFGPGRQELERVHDLLDSIFVHQPDVRWVVLIDDDPEDKDLLGEVARPDGCTVVRLVNSRASRRKPRVHPARGPLCAKTLMGLAWLEANARPSFVARLDTDALVIAPFAERLEAYFERHPDVAAVSCYRHDCNGAPRGLHPWPKVLRQMKRWAVVNRTPPFLHLSVGGDRARRRRAIERAEARGYVLGESCFGGAMAVTGAYLRRLRENGFLDDPFLWFDTRMADDVLLSLYAYAVGMRIADMVEDEVFGVKYPGLPDSPQRLLERNFAIIHALKGDDRYAEEDVRAFFRAHRKGAVGGSATPTLVASA